MQESKKIKEYAFDKINTALLSNLYLNLNFSLETFCVSCRYCHAIDIDCAAAETFSMMCLNLAVWTFFVRPDYIKNIILIWLLSFDFNTEREGVISVQNIRCFEKE